MKTIKNLSLLVLVCCLMRASAYGQSAPTAGPGAMGSTASPYSEHTRTASISQILQHNPKLADRVKSMLPQDTELRQVAQGFLEIDDFVAAVHAADNLKIPFDQLRAKLVGPDSVSLKKAIRMIKPDADNKAAAKLASSQARHDLKELRYKG
jgi:hypothetical protein